MQTTPPLLSVTSLTFHIGKTAIVDGLSLELHGGEVLGLIGPNGAGKTTALDLISGFSKPAEGRISLIGRNVTGLQPYQLVRQGLCRTFQESPPIAGLTVIEHLDLANAVQRTGTFSHARMTTADLLSQFGLASLKSNLAEDLPTPERRLLDVARAVATRPIAVLLDEPFAGLSPDQRALVLKHIRSWKADGMAVLVVEHRLADLDQIADRVVVMVTGRQIAEGKMKDVLATPEVQRAYLRAMPTHAPGEGNR